MLKRFLTIFVISYCSLVIGFLPALGAEYYFNPHFILTNEEMTDFDSMSLADIQLFLINKKSGLANLVLSDYLGLNKKASEIIWQAALEGKINPRVLLATLQKEQSLITDPAPTQNQLDKAMGYRCPDNDVCNPKALGFGKQVDGAAWQFRQYLDQPSNWNFRAGLEYDIDGFLITPVNITTAAFYNYTPHYSGNKRLWQIWQDFFGRNYPDGSLLKASDNPAVWLIEYGSRRLITSWGILLSRFDPKKIITIPRPDLEKYQVGSDIKFHNYSLLKIPDGKIYLLVDNNLRHIASMEVFRSLGFNLDEVLAINEIDLTGYQFGEQINAESVYPVGALLQNQETGGVYYVENSQKSPIYSPEILKVNFPKKAITKVDSEELDQYPTSEPAKFKNGELIKQIAYNKVYVISDGFRRWVKTEEAFVKLGYKWDNIITTSEAAVNIHPLGEDLE